LLTRLNLGHANAGAKAQARIAAPVPEPGPARLERRCVRGVNPETVDDKERIR